jgi:hypothetical protein
MAAGAGVLPRGLPLRLLTGVAVAAVATLLVAVIWLAEPDPVVTDPGPDDVVRVGLVDGQSIPGYLNSSHGELVAMARTPGTTATWALVTLQSYLPPDRLTPLLSGVAVAQVYARAPLDGAQTRVVRIPAYRIPDDVVAGMLDAAARSDQERADYRQLSLELRGTGENEIRLRRAYDTAARVAGDEASAYRARCSCVFAAVVRAAPSALSAVADRAGVRAVDPAPEVRRLDRAEFRPPSPEQRTTMPSEPPGAPTVAPASSAPLPSSLGAGVISASSAGPTVGSGASVPASEEHAAVPSAPVLSQGPGAPAATSGASGR